MMPSPYIIVDYEGDIIGCRLLLPRLVRLNEVKVASYEEAHDELYKYALENYGKPLAFNVSKLGYIYIPKEASGDKTILAPGYYALAVYSNALVTLMYVYRNKQPEIIEGKAMYASIDHNCQLVIQVNNSENPLNKVLDTIIYIVIIVVAVLNIIYIVRTRKIEQR